MGSSSLSSLQSVCDELPDQATLPMRCVPTDPDNVRPLLEAGEERFGTIDAVLANNRSNLGNWRRAMNMQVVALAMISEVAEPFLKRSGGHLVIAGSRSGSHTRQGAMKTVARDAKRTLQAALAAEWSETGVQVSLVEPVGLDGPKAMARQIARVLNGAPQRQKDALQRNAIGIMRR